MRRSARCLLQFLRRPTSFGEFEFLEHESMRLLGSTNGDTERPSSLPGKANAPPIGKRAKRRPKRRSKNASTAPLVGTEAMLPEESMTADASPMITAYYEAYLDMRKMLAVLAELRGDDPQDALEQARAPSTSRSLRE